MSLVVGKGRSGAGGGIGGIGELERDATEARDVDASEDIETGIEGVPGVTDGVVGCSLSTRGGRTGKEVGSERSWDSAWWILTAREGVFTRHPDIPIHI